MHGPYPGELRTRVIACTLDKASRPTLAGRLGQQRLRCCALLFCGYGEGAGEALSGITTAIQVKLDVLFHDRHIPERRPSF